MKVNKKAIVIGGLVAAGIVYASRTERGTKARRRVSRKVNLPDTLDNAKEATREGVARAQEVLSKSTSAVRKAATSTKQD